nr:hypothetical protein HmN_000874400 [Hymenolepis microstoma]
MGHKLVTGLSYITTNLIILLIEWMERKLVPEKTGSASDARESTLISGTACDFVHLLPRDVVAFNETMFFFKSNVVLQGVVKAMDIMDNNARGFGTNNLSDHNENNRRTNFSLSHCAGREATASELQQL